MLSTTKFQIKKKKKKALFLFLNFMLEFNLLLKIDGSYGKQLDLLFKRKGKN